MKDLHPQEQIPKDFQIWVTNVQNRSHNYRVQSSLKNSLPHLKNSHNIFTYIPIIPPCDNVEIIYSDMQGS